MAPKVSIILPCYRAERYIADMVGDVIRQTFSDWELIVVSNGAEQEPQLAILEELKHSAGGGKITILSEEKGSVSRARNIGIDHATGEWLVFVDADDRLEPNHLQLLVDATHTGEPDIIVGGGSSCNAKGTLIRSTKLCEHEMMVSKRWLMELKGKPTRVLRTQMYRASLVKDHQLRFDEKWTYGEDTIFSCQCILAAERIKAIPRVGYRYISHRASVTKSYMASLYGSKVVQLSYEGRILQQAGFSKEEIKAVVHQRKYTDVKDSLSNLFLPHCPLKYSEKVREVRRIVFEDPDMPDVMRKEDRKEHGIYNRFVFDVAYDLHSPQLIAFVSCFLDPVVKFWREHIKVLLRRQPSN